jgi:DNA-binding transcriptional regulator YiaG
MNQLAINATVPLAANFQVDETCEALLKGASNFLFKPSSSGLGHVSTITSISSSLTNPTGFLPVQITADGALQTSVSFSNDDLRRVYASKVGRIVAPHSTTFDQEILGEVAMQSHGIFSVAEKIKKIRTALDVSESEIALILRCSRQSLHNWNNPDRASNSINAAKDRALNSLFQVALIWQKVGLDFSFSDYSSTPVSDKILRELLSQEHLTLEALLGHLRGMEQLHEKHLNSIEQEKILIASGFTLSDSVSF